MVGDSCLLCGSDSDYDGLQCCPGCTRVTSGAYAFCDCEGPTPAPGPSPSGDVWDSYTVAGMDVISVVGGGGGYDKVVILLHGGGGSAGPAS